MSELVMRSLAITRRELIGEGLSADTVDRDREVVVRDRRAARLDGPERLRKRADGRGGIKTWRCLSRGACG